MKVAIYSDRLLDDYFGGAEAYSIRLAALLATQHDVTIFCNRVDNASKWKQSLRQKFRELTPDIKIVQISGVGAKGNPAHKEWRAHKALKKYIKNFDIFINISNNLVPGFDTVPSYALIHFPIYLHKKTLMNFPFANYINKKYVNSYKKLIGNSKFTAENIEKMYGRKADYIYPIAHLNSEKPDLNKKRDNILYVGRIDHDKEIEILIDAFKNLHDKSSDKDLKLTIAGFCSNQTYLKKLKNKAETLPITFETNATAERLKQLFTESKIYWHSKGYNKNEPWQMEHFGMTTVEAMSYGCIPIVFNGGGQIEIVSKECGFLWNLTEELLNKTIDTINNNNRATALSKSSFLHSNDFTTTHYLEKLYTLIDEIN